MKSSGYFSRNFFNPPNLSFKIEEIVVFEVEIDKSCSIFPTSPTGKGPLSFKTSIVIKRNADSHTYG